MFYELTVIVDGALDGGITFEQGEDDEFTAFIENTAKESMEHGLKTEVFVLIHDHEQDDDGCECVQFLTDHHPDYSWN